MSYLHFKSSLAIVTPVTAGFEHVVSSAVKVIKQYFKILSDYSVKSSDTKSRVARKEC